MSLPIQCQSGSPSTVKRDGSDCSRSFHIASVRRTNNFDAGGDSDDYIAEVKYAQVSTSIPTVKPREA